MLGLVRFWLTCWNTCQNTYINILWSTRVCVLVCVYKKCLCAWVCVCVCVSECVCVCSNMTLEILKDFNQTWYTYELKFWNDLYRGKTHLIPYRVANSDMYNNLERQILAFIVFRLQTWMVTLPVPFKCCNLRTPRVGSGKGMTIIKNRKWSILLSNL